jgi:hypothetical protein
LIRCGAVSTIEQMIADKMRTASAALDVAPITDDARAVLAELAELLAWRHR